MRFTFDPFALPSPSAFAYRLLNIVSVLAIITAVNFLFLGGRQTAWLLIFGVIAAVSVLVSMSRSARALRERATPVDPGEADRIRQRFQPFAEGVDFRQNDGEDARAIDIGSPTCVLGRRYVVSLTDQNNEIDESKPQFVVAHELSHLISNDSQSFINAAALVAGALGLGFSCFIAVLSGNLTFDIRTIAGFGYLGALYFAMIYWVIRVREFYADKIAGLIVGEEVGHNVLSKAVRTAKYISYPPWYYVTHPGPAKRLKNYETFGGIFAYSASKLLLCSFVVSCAVILIPMSFFSFSAAFTDASLGLSSIIALFFMGAILVLGVWIEFYIIFHLVVPATIAADETFIGVTFKCLVLMACVFANIEVISLLILRREILSFAVDKVSPEKIVLTSANLLLTHWVFFFMAKQFRKMGGGVIGARLQRRWQWCGAIIATVLVALGNTSRTLIASWLAGTAGADDVTSLVIVGIVCLVLTGIPYLAWRRAVRKNAKQILELRQAKESEIGQRSTGDRYYIGIDLVRPPILVRIGCYVAMYFVGLYVFEQLAAINDPDLAPLGEVSDDLRNEWNFVMRSSRDTAYLFAWTVFFPIMLFISGRKAERFPAKKVMTVIAR